MTRLILIWTTFLFACLCMGCSIAQRLTTNAIYYKEFDLFKLSGRDTIPVSKTREGQDTGFVKVSYDNGLPYTITYYSANRQVILKLESNFKVHDRIIYVYSTGNLPGGKAGRQREYSLRYINNVYRLYVDLSDTLLVKHYDAIDAKSGNSYHYTVNVYTKKENQFSYYFLLQDDIQGSMKEDSLYVYWKEKLKKLKPEAIINLAAFPPK